MILKRIYDDKLAQASYLVGCAATGEAVVVDPNRDVDQYLALAAKEELRITAITETHIHADYVSGSRELAHRTGATLYLSDEGDADWKYGFASEPGVKLVRDGDRFKVGNIRFDIWHTPGHTPEHITLVVTDEPASDLPVLAFTGDFVFVGDVGRPDLLEKAAGASGTMEPGARRLFHSLQRFTSLPDHLQIWPAHGSGSACGKSLGGVPVTTLGYEKRSSWAFAILTEDAFVQEVLAGQPEPPVYFARMKRINKIGPRILDGKRQPPRLGSEMVHALLTKGETIVDIRPSSSYLQENIPGTLHIPSGSLFTNWSGWLLDYEHPVYLLAEDEEQVAAAVRDLAMIGLDEVAGWFGPDAIKNHAQRGGQVEAAAPLSPASLDAFRTETGAAVLDVRGINEWKEGHIPGAIHIPLGYLKQRARELPKEGPVVVHCQSGGRSPIAISVLRQLGFTDLRNLTGGYAEYRKGDSPPS